MDNSTIDRESLRDGDRFQQALPGPGGSISTYNRITKLQSAWKQRDEDAFATILEVMSTPPSTS